MTRLASFALALSLTLCVGAVPASIPAPPLHASPALLHALMATVDAPIPVAATDLVPEAAAMYRRQIEQAAVEVWGVHASVARLAAQIHQESMFRARARSRV